MCLILFAHHVHPEYPLIMAANRDEFFARSTTAATFWPEDHSLLAGRDLRNGGTWLGVNRNGRIAAVTNFRKPHDVKQPAPSRGNLVRAFLQGSDTPASYLADCHAVATDYEGYNLLVGSGDELGYYTNHASGHEILDAGVYGLGNTFINAKDWPKVTKGIGKLERLLLDGRPLSTEALFALLNDRETAPDNDIPSTDLPSDLAKALSAIFIEKTDRNYGTRCSTVLMRHRNGTLYFAERTFSDTGDSLGTVYQHFPLVNHV